MTSGADGATEADATANGGGVGATVALFALEPVEAVVGDGVGDEVGDEGGRFAAEASGPNAAIGGIAGAGAGPREMAGD